MMNRSIQWMVLALFVVAAFTAGVFFKPQDTLAQKKAGALGKQIQGSWILVSMYNEQDGKKVDVFGPNPKGLWIFTPDGSFSQIITQASLPKFASNNRTKGTVEENQAVVQGTYAVFGKYKVASDKEQTVNIHIVGSTFPNFVDQDQKRTITVSGDELKVTNPSSTLGGGTNYSVWKRSK